MNETKNFSEYVPAAYMRRAFLTDFHGSAGTAVVLRAGDGSEDDDNSNSSGAAAAYLWTDSRYWNEAGLQMDSRYWTLQKSGSTGVPTIPKWLASTALTRYQQNAASGANNNSNKPALRIGIDPFVHSASFVKEVQEQLDETAKEEGLDDGCCLGVLVTEHENLVDPIWGTARPAIPTSPFRVHPLQYAGVSVIEKLQSIRKEMTCKKSAAAVFCTLDDVAYLFNLRATGDIDTCPVGIAYGLVTDTDAFLYCDAKKIASEAVQQHLTKNGVTARPYEDIVADVQAHCGVAADAFVPDGDSKVQPLQERRKLTKQRKVWLDTSRANYALSAVIPESNLLDVQNAVTPMKASKNAAELAGMREAHIVDGIAMAKFMAWLENEINIVGRVVSEVEIDRVLTGFRAEQKGFIECSFPTIAGVGSNGAIIHYRASESSDLVKYLDKTLPILIDSGGQYEYGTTDVTRTWSFQDKPDPTFVDYYTRVLKGNIGLDVMVFPENTPGFVLDVYARRWLWDKGDDYGHGTSHGVGAALNVHEGPMSIAPRWTNREVLKRGMVLSNEPGYYEDGNFGIRIENLIEISYVKPEHNAEPNDTPSGDGKKKFLKFSKLTMIPIQKNLIDASMMTKEELDWVDSYHADVLEKVGSRLEKGSPALKWLQRACEKIERTSTK
jgi:Xaa-Pro aminopeptidase